MKIFNRVASAAVVLALIQISGVGKDRKQPCGQMLGRLIPGKPGDNPNFSYSDAYGINNPGHVVGRALAGKSPEDSAPHAFLSIDGKMTDLGMLPGYEAGSGATAINESGQIVGYSTQNKNEYDDGEHTHAFLYEKGKMRDLGTLGGSYSRAYAINKPGQIIGVSTIASGDARSFICEGGKMRDMGDFKNYKSYSADAIDDSGGIAGTTSTNSHDNQPHLFYYKNGEFHDLGPTGGPTATVEAMNNAGDIVGEYFVGNEKRTHAFLYSGGKITDMTKSISAPDGKSCSATAINNRGEILIEVDMAREEHLYYIYRKGKVIDLQKEINKSGYQADWITGMNDAGQVMCIGGTPEARESFLFTY